MADLLDRLESKEAEADRAHQVAYGRLVATLAAGGNVDDRSAEETLQRAGKRSTDLRADVKKASELADLRTKIAAGNEARERRKDLSRQHEAIRAEHAEKKTAFEQEWREKFDDITRRTAAVQRIIADGEAAEGALKDKLRGGGIGYSETLID